MKEKSNKKNNSQIKKSRFDEAVDTLTDSLRIGLSKNPNEQEWLQKLFESYTKRFTEDNSRIWTTGSILVPISLAGFAAYAQIDRPLPIHIWTLASASSAIMIAWLFIAENHRAFQQKSLAWITAIQKYLGIEDTIGPYIKGNLFNRIFTFSGAIQTMRYVLAFGVLTGWYFILRYHCLVP